MILDRRKDVVPDLFCGWWNRPGLKLGIGKKQRKCCYRKREMEKRVDIWMCDENLKIEYF